MFAKELLTLRHFHCCSKCFTYLKDKSLKGELLGQRVCTFVILKGLAKSLSLEILPLYLYQECLQVPVSFTNTLFANLIHETSCFSIILIFISLITSEFDHLFICLKSVCFLFCEMFSYIVRFFPFSIKEISPLHCKLQIFLRLSFVFWAYLHWFFPSRNVWFFFSYSSVIYTFILWKCLIFI